MRLVSIKDFDIINSLNISVSVWCGYCPIRCEGCHNSKYWSKDSGIEFNDKHLDIILKKLEEGVSKDLSILGGEPLADLNVGGVTKLIKAVKETYPSKKIMLWTGMEWDEIKDYECIKFLDIVIDGKYEHDNKNKTCRLIGSSNQRIIMAKESLSTGEVIVCPRELVV